MINFLVRQGFKLACVLLLYAQPVFAQELYPVETTQTIDQPTTITTQSVAQPTTVTTQTVQQPTTVTTQNLPVGAAVTTQTIQSAPPVVPTSSTTNVVTTQTTTPPTVTQTVEPVITPTGTTTNVVTTQTAPTTVTTQTVEHTQDTNLNEYEEWLRSNNQNTTLTGVRPFRRNRVRSGRPLTYEEGQKRLLASAPQTLIPQSPDAGAAFNTMVRQNIPLSPRQVVQLHQEIDRSQRASAIPATIPPKPVSTTIMVNLAPGTTPPAIRLAQGYVSALMFVDSTGTAWPIASFDVGNPKAVNLQWDGKSNVILIQAVSPYMNGDIVVRLIGLPTPITLELVAGQRVVDYRCDIHVSGIGPNTKEIPVGTNLPSSANQLLLGVLDGVAPSGSKILLVHGADAQAYLLEDRMFLRTRLTLLSPGWVGKMASPDGTNAYELPRTSSVLVSRYGEPIELKIEGF